MGSRIVGWGMGKRDRWFGDGVFGGRPYRWFGMGDAIIGWGWEGPIVGSGWGAPSLVWGWRDAITFAEGGARSLVWDGGTRSSFFLITLASYY